MTGARAQATGELGENFALSAETQPPLTLKGFLLAQPSEVTMQNLWGKPLIFKIYILSISLEMIHLQTLKDTEEHEAGSSHLEI